MNAPRIADCPLARTVATVGPWWTLEILHEVFGGFTTFAEIRANLTAQEDILRERLADLVARDLLRVVGDGEYEPTELGRSLRPLLLVMAAVGNNALAAADRSVVLVDRETGDEAEPVVVDSHTGRRMDTGAHVFARGPRASEPLRARYPEPPRPRTPELARPHAPELARPRTGAPHLPRGTASGHDGPALT